MSETDEAAEEGLIVVFFGVQNEDEEGLLRSMRQ